MYRKPRKNTFNGAYAILRHSTLYNKSHNRNRDIIIMIREYFNEYIYVHQHGTLKAANATRKGDERG